MIHLPANAFCHIPTKMFQHLSCQDQHQQLTPASIAIPGHPPSTEAHSLPAFHDQAARRGTRTADIYSSNTPTPTLAVMQGTRSRLDGQIPSSHWIREQQQSCRRIPITESAPPTLCLAPGALSAVTTANSATERDHRGNSSLIGYSWHSLPRHHKHLCRPLKVYIPLLLSHMIGHRDGRNHLRGQGGST